MSTNIKHQLDDIQWIVPPECQGQIVEVAYSKGSDRYAYMRVTDRSDNSVAYYVFDIEWLGDKAPKRWEPWKGTPDVADDDWKPLEEQDGGWVEIRTTGRYYALLDGGEGGAGWFDAEDLDDAWNQAVEWTLDGAWGEGGYVVTLYVRSDETDEDGDPVEERDEPVEIPQDEELLDEHRRDHERSGHEHEWESPHSLVGGLQENPGVQSHGGLHISAEYRCACGARRVENVDRQRLPCQGPTEWVTIDYPDGVWPWGERCAYPGKSAVT